LSKKDFDEIPRRVVDEGLSATRETVEHLHFHAKSSFAERIIAADSCFLQKNSIITTTELTE